ncbi:hypothetical protein [Ornithinimicrobium kibberense]|uniref:hypothetical protein n=1 Tax=Ornithinimicrobium kibberense TaxID=282060 RepID=UPI0036136CB8
MDPAAYGGGGPARGVRRAFRRARGGRRRPRADGRPGAPAAGGALPREPGRARVGAVAPAGAAGGQRAPAVAAAVGAAGRSRFGAPRVGTVASCVACCAPRTCTHGPIAQTVRALP